MQQAKPRITVVETVSFQEPGEQPISSRQSFVAYCEGSDAAYVRPHMMIGEEWTPLDTGWIKDPGMVLVVNLEGHFTQVIPTQAERDEAELRVLEVGKFACVPPREDLRIRPTKPMFLRSRHGQIKIAVTVYPK